MKTKTMARFIYFTALLVCCCFAIIGQVNATMCSFDEHTFQDVVLTKKVKCVKCERCPPGKELSQPCGSNERIPVGTNVACINCKHGYFAENDDYFPCKKCSPPCDSKEMELAECTKKQNRICSCQAGLYRHAATGKCSQECCFCVEGTSEERDCLKLSDGRICGNNNPDGKCNLPVPSTPTVPVPPTLNNTPTTSDTTRTENGTSTIKNDKSNRIDYLSIGLGLGGFVLVIFGIGIALYWKNCKRSEYNPTKSDENKNIVVFSRSISSESTTSLRRRHLSSAESQSDDDIKVNLLPATPEDHESRYPTHDEILNAEDQRCITNCEKVFGAKRLFDESGHWLNIESVFDNIPFKECEKQLQTLASLFDLSFRYPQEMRIFMVLLEQSYPEVQCKSFVKALRCIKREDVVKAIHQKMHSDD